MTLSTTRQAPAPEILDRCRELVRPALVESVRRLHPWHAETAAFSLGWSGVTATRSPARRARGSARRSRCSARRPPGAAAGTA
ncbi:hypothetical protein SMICM304S_10439 [Streptomyces microflavus]